jgi:hypothetical protein
VARVVEDGKWANRSVPSHCQHSRYYGDSRTIATPLDAKAQTPSQFDVDHDRLYMYEGVNPGGFHGNLTLYVVCVLHLSAHFSGVDTPADGVDGAKFQASECPRREMGG